MSTVQKACIPKKTPKTPDFPLLFRLDPFRQIIQIHPAVHFLLQGPLRGFFFFHQLLQFCVLRSSFPYGRLQLSQLFLQNGDVIFDGVKFPLLFIGKFQLLAVSTTLPAFFRDLFGG